MTLATAVSGISLVASLLLASGCAVRSTPSGGEGRGGEGVEMALEVENHNWSDIIVYLMRGNQSHRLGMVTAVSTAHFAFPYRHLGTGGNTRLRAYPIGGRRAVTSENLLVQPGQWIKWTLETDLARSFLAVQ